MSRDISENSYYMFVVLLVFLTILSSFLILQERNINLNNVDYYNNFINLHEKDLNINDTFDIIKFQRYNSLGKESVKNSQGYKDTEWSIEKPSNTKRIIAIGDSLTQGPFVTLENIWPTK